MKTKKHSSLDSEICTGCRMPRAK